MTQRSRILEGLACVTALDSDGRAEARGLPCTVLVVLHARGKALQAEDQVTGRRSSL